MNWLDRGSAAGDRYLPETIRLLWPPPAELSTTASGMDGECWRRTYLVVPSANRPKVLIPATPRRAAAAAIRGFKSTQQRTEAGVLAALAAALRVGAGLALRDRLYVSIPRNAVGTDLPSHLSDTLHRTVHVSLHVSEPRAVRKPVLQLIDDAGHTFAFAKIGVNPFTDALVRGEAATVRRLGTVPWAALRVPALLHAGTWRDHAIGVQQALPRGTDGGDEPAIATAMHELATVGGTTTSPLAASSFRARLAQRAGRLPTTPSRAAVLDSLAALAESAAATPIEFGAWHGDWTPWNMNVCGGRVQVWDWEKFEVGVPIGFDAAHYFVQRAVVRARRRPVDAFAELIERAEPIRTAHGASLPAARVIAWVYALELAVGYLEDREPDVGHAPLTRLEDWLLPTLRRAAACVPALTT